MIGQKEVLKQIDNLIEKGFPRFIVMTGRKGQGKTELAKYISKKLNISMIEIGIKIDEIREMIEMAYKQTEPIIYLIQNADKMSLGARNSLLKVIEEPPQQAYFIMELQQIENTLSTIRSRCQEIRMDLYSEDEIEEMVNNINPELDRLQRVIMHEIASNYYQIDLLNSYDVSKFYNFIEKVVDNIYKVQSANSFKLVEKLKLKDTEEGYDINLFFITYRVICLNKAQILIDQEPFKEEFTHLLNSCNITAKYINKLNINGINRQMLVDNWILDIRKEWLK